MAGVTRSLVIFAGGHATRLGGVNKALLEIGGRTIARRISDALQPLVDEVLILANDPSIGSHIAGRLVFDPEPHAGVLPALANGLDAASGELCLAVACDMPFVSRAAFERLLELQRAEDADVVIPRTEGHLEPMHAVYRRTPVLAAIRDALARREQRMISYFGAVKVVEVPEEALRALSPEAAGAFFNVNTPADLEEAQRRASAET